MRKDLKGMMTRRNDAAIGKSNDNIDHKNVVITCSWISFVDEVKCFS